MENDKFVNMLEKQYNDNPMETVKALMSFIDKHVQTSQDAARYVGVSAATFNGFWNEDIDSANDPIKFELSRIAQSYAIESNLWHGKRYLTDGMKSLKAKRDELYAGKQRIREQALVTKSDLMAYASLVGVTLADDEKITAMTLSEKLAAVIGCDALQLRVAIKQSKDAEREAAEQRKLALLATLKAGAVEPTK